MASDFICPECEHRWTMEEDENGLYDGYGNPPCPLCATNGCDPNDYGDFLCPRGHTWRSYGNGGLVLGTVPRCPQHGLLPDHL